MKTVSRVHLMVVAGLLGGLAWSCATGDDPCDPNPCVTPPGDSCQGSVALIYPASGACHAVGDLAECTYEPAQTDCNEAGLFCAGGQCQADPCDPNPCTNPTLDGCDGNVRVSYEAVGLCEASGATVDCSYPEAGRVDCTLAGEVCELGACVSADPCSPNPCTTPPQDTCIGQTANQHPALGVCADVGGTADCTYSANQVDCTANSQVCENGLCVDPSPCNPNPCTNPPVDSCQGNTAYTYVSPGSCTDSGGTPSCDYPPATEDCSLSSLACLGGACVTPGSGTLMISEYVEGSSFNKYIELYNPSSSAANLGEYQIDFYFNGSVTSSSTLTLASTVLQPGQVYVIADDAHTLWTTPGPDEVFGASFFNGNDAVVLANSTTSARVDIVGVIGDAAVFGQDTTFVRNAGVVNGVTGPSWNPAEWTALPNTDDHQLGSHTP